ncbi:MAG: Gx transporter family protein [Eubacteriales bacterium]|nr:Gx transporter family protein [Eubacteriales bacterium]
MTTKKLTQLAMLTGIAFALFVVELQLPGLSPVPGMKLGLANIITVYALFHYRPGDVILVVLARILLGALFSGSGMSLLYSMSGSAFCLTGMLLLKNAVGEQTIWISGIFGAILHNTGQIVMAILVTRTPGVIVYLPLLLVSGVLTGAFTGLCAQAVIRKLPAAAVDR